MNEIFDRIVCISLIEREDKKLKIAKRFDEYVNNVVPSMNYFKGKVGYTMCTINGAQSIEEVHHDIIKSLNL